MNLHRIIAEQDPTGHWASWIDGKPQTSFGGVSAAQAVTRLLGFADLNADDIHAVLSRCSDQHQEFIVGGQPCDACDGSGRYVGLNTVEDCGECGGAGVVSMP